MRNHIYQDMAEDIKTRRSDAIKETVPMHPTVMATLPRLHHRHFVCPPQRHAIGIDSISLEVPNNFKFRDKAGAIMI